MRQARAWKVLVGMLLLPFIWTATASALEVVYPADRTWIERSDYLIIKGGTNPSLESVVVRVNGVDSDPIDISGQEYRAAFADMLILQPEWEKGKNLVEVVGFVGGKQAATARAEFFSLAGSLTVIPPKGFQRFVMHLPEKEKLCAPCHNMNPDKVQLAAGTADANPCGSCHKRMLERKFVHGPAGVYQCVDCHDRGSKPARYRLIKENAELCNECHIDKVDEFNKNDFVHGPVGVGLCTTCHDPHASDNPAQLHAPINAVCLGCHSTVRAGEHVVRGVGGNGHPLEGKKDPVNVGRPLSCASCHAPHGGKSRYLFVRGINGRFQLCQECHKK